MYCAIFRFKISNNGSGRDYFWAAYRGAFKGIQVAIPGLVPILSVQNIAGALAIAPEMRVIVVALLPIRGPNDEADAKPNDLVRNSFINLAGDLVEGLENVIFHEGTPAEVLRWLKNEQDIPITITYARRTATG